MTIVRIIARPLLASGFVANGVESFRNSSRSAAHLEPVLGAVERAVPQAKDALSNRAVVAQAIAAAQVGAGVAYGTGTFPRLAAPVLAATTGLNAYLDFQASERGSDEQRASRRSHALKNVSLVGATLLAAVDTNGRPSLAWRASHALNSAQKSFSSFNQSATKRLESAQKEAAKRAESAQKGAAKRVQGAQKDASKRLQAAQKAVGNAPQPTGKAAQKAAEQVKKRAAARMDQARKAAKKAAKQAQKSR